MATDNKLIDNYTQNIGTVTDSRGHEVHRLQLELEDHKDSTGYVVYTDATFTILDLASRKAVSSYKISNRGLFNTRAQTKNRDTIIPLAAQPELLQGLVNVVKNARQDRENAKRYRDSIYNLQDELGMVKTQLEIAQIKLEEAGIKLDQPKKAKSSKPKVAKGSLRETLDRVEADRQAHPDLYTTPAPGAWPPAGFALTATAANVLRVNNINYAPTHAYYWGQTVPAVEETTLTPAAPEPNDPF